MPEEEEEEQEIENLFGKIMKLPQSGEGNRHTSPGSSECPKEVGSKKELARTIQSDKKKGPTTKITPSGKTII